MSEHHQVYHPKEHSGLKKDGNPDKRVKHTGQQVDSDARDQQSHQHSEQKQPHVKTQQTSLTMHARNTKNAEAEEPPSKYVYDDTVEAYEKAEKEAFGGSKATGEFYHPTEHGGLKKDGTRDHRVKNAHDKGHK